MMTARFPADASPAPGSASIRWIFAALAAVAILATCVVVVMRYHGEITEARARAARSSVALTPCGRIEYTVTGNGPPVLVVHGAGGGFDQGEALGAPLAAAGFRVIAPSRFGYLRTPRPTDASPQAQADAHGCLLDTLGYQRVAVLAASAGAPSAMQLAIRHPARVSALVLMVPAAYAPRPNHEASVKTPPGLGAISRTALSSDFFFWGATHVARDTMMRAVLGTPPEAVDAASPAEKERIHRLLADVLPVSSRHAGLMNDARVVSSLDRYELERIAMPTLALSAADDLYGTFDAARYTATLVPHGRFVGYLSGGHMLAGHGADASTAIVEFLSSVMPAEAGIQPKR